MKEEVGIPNNTIELGFTSYVGRVVQYNLILPAEVFNSSYAVAFDFKTKTEFNTKQFEVLTYSDKEICQWKYLDNLRDVPENVVRVGRSWDREPIYLGAAYYYVEEKHIASILLTSNKFISKAYTRHYALFCDDNPSWIDATYPKIPSNTVRLSEHNIVARLEGPYSLIPAIYNNITRDCSSVFKRIEINSLSCQVLTTNSSEYSWKAPGKFERIPENAVAQGRDENNELVYISRDHFQNFAPITFSKVAFAKYTYEVLVKNEV